MISKVGKRKFFFIHGKNPKISFFCIILNFNFENPFNGVFYIKESGTDIDIMLADNWLQSALKKYSGSVLNYCERQATLGNLYLAFVKYVKV